MMICRFRRTRAWLSAWLSPANSKQKEVPGEASQIFSSLTLGRPHGFAGCKRTGNKYQWQERRRSGELKTGLTVVRPLISRGQSRSGRSIITSPCNSQGNGETWGAVRLSDYSLAQTAYVRWPSPNYGYPVPNSMPR